MAGAPSYGGSIKDGYYDVPVPGVVRSHGAWIEGYYDYEKHDNLNPRGEATNNPTRRTVSGGVLSGVDVSQFQSGTVVKGHQLGFLAGYNSTRAKFTDTTTINRAAGLDGLDTQVDRFSNVRQEFDGAMIGAYASTVHGPVSADIAVKVDLFQVERRFTQRSALFYDCNGVNDLTRAPDSVTNAQFIGSTSMTNVTVASNVNYRIPLSSNHYLEPTVGLRWTHTDFGNSGAALGLRDGDVFRVQGGLRLGMRHTMPDGWVWNTTLTGLLYSDVIIDGFTVATPVGSPFASFNAQVDEGKLRAMGILESRVDVGFGYTFYGDVEVRGGDDVIGFGSRLGIRKQW